MTKKIMVDKQDFEKNFLESIKSFVPKCEFFPLHFVDGKLVTFCANRQENGTLALYVEHTPLASNFEEGEVLYIKEPQKLLSAIKLISDERIILKVKDHQLVCVTDDLSFSLVFYDKNLAKRDKTFWQPKKFHEIRESFKEGLLLEKTLISKIKATCNVVDLDIVSIEKEDDEMHITVGNSNTNAVKTKLPFSESFSDKSQFIKNMFLFLGKHDATLYETEDEKAIGFKEESDNNKKYYLVTKIPKK